MIKLKVGDMAPDFSGEIETGEQIRLSDYRGKKVILFFYPKDDSPGCTKEACNLRDNYKVLQKEGFEILGISPDKVAKHQKFINKYEFQFSLVADPERQIIESYGLWGPKIFMGREVTGVYRTTFLIDEDGRIMHIIDNVKTKEHAEQILSAIAQEV